MSTHSRPQALCQQDLQLLACPACHASLHLDDDVIVCAGCHRSFAIVDNLPVLILTD